MKKWLQLALGILTAVGGFFDIGALATGAQAGASFRFQHLWAVLFSTVLVIVLVEMSGRFAAVTRMTFVDAIRDHFGFTFWLGPFVILTLIHFLTLSAEIGGVCFALHLVSGLPTAAWALPVAIVTWLFLWRATFSSIENATSVLGLLTLAFVVAAVRHHPPTGELLAGLLPSFPKHDGANYWYIAVGIIGAVLSPYLFYFYSSGAVEDEWDASYVGVNRGISAIGMGFGSLIAMGAIVVAAMTIAPRGIEVEDYHQAALMLTDAFPFWGFLLFAAGLGIACFGAALEVGLSIAYTTAQTFGWNWGENIDPREDSRFCLSYTVAILLASLLILFGIDPLKLTLLTMAVNAAILPFVTIPFLLIMNDRKLLGKNANGWFTNTVTLILIAVSFLLAVVSIPLMLIGG